ncbi:MAG TPA: zinc ribbon domain-containing protein [Polyangiaceae bacterium]|jgi:putative FmdB family regulatory protein|nr:zinc ribbon domain-containing protein [Polyangiaceae bacterium]
MTYEYVCTACGHGWEAEQAISAAPLKTCPKCGTDHAKRQISGGAGFILKGGGWYADGYGSSKSGGSSTSSALDSSSSSETKSETKTESKPEAKAETKTETAKSTAGSSTT